MLYYTHVEITKMRCPNYRIINFMQFVEKFDKQKWYMHNKFDGSLFANIEAHAIHNDMIIFDRIGYVASNFLTYFRIKHYVKRYIKKNFDKIEKIDRFGEVG